MDTNKLLNHGIILLAAITLFVCIIFKNGSCSSQTNSEELIESTPIPDVEVVHYTYKEHSYIVFRNEYHNRVGLTHDPNCNKCKEELKELIIEVINNTKE